MPGSGIFEKLLLEKASFIPTISAEARSRVRKACLNCRRRKSRCILSRTSDGKGPCERCARENVECEIPLTTRRGGFANVLAGKERQKREAMFMLQAMKDAPQRAGPALDSTSQHAPPPQPPQPPQAVSASPLVPMSTQPQSQLAPQRSQQPHSVPSHVGINADPAYARARSEGFAVPNVESTVQQPHTGNSQPGSYMPQSVPSSGLPHSVPFNSSSSPPATDTQPAAAEPAARNEPEGPGSALHRELYNVNDALNILCSVVNDQGQHPSRSPDPNNPLTRLPPSAHLNGSAHRTFLPPIIPPQPSQKEPYANNVLAQKGFISVSQIVSLVQFFFDRFEPFVPFVHQQFGVNVRLPQHTLLLTTICAISAKYSPDANLRVLQTKLWEQCKKLLAEMPWAIQGGDKESEDQVAGSVLALLLLCEWWLDGLDTIEQYNCVSWIRLGTAVRLAQWSGILQNNKPVYIALHWLENVIGCRIGVQPALNVFSPPPNIKQQLTTEDHARLEVVNLLHLGYRTLYSSREATRESVDNGSYLLSLQLLHSFFERWLQDFAAIARDKQSWQARSVMFEFNHCRLYVYSLALAQQNSRGAGAAGVSAFMESRKYLPFAIDSAVAIIDFETDPSNSVGLQLGPPMRWIVRFIHATVFLAKAIMCPPLVHPTETAESLAAVVCKAAKAMENVGPDNFQLMGQYIKMMNDIKDHVMEHMCCNRTTSPPNGQASQHQSTGPSSPSLEGMQRLCVLSVDGAPSLTYCDLLDDCEVLAGVDNAMLYMPAQSDGDSDTPAS